MAISLGQHFRGLGDEHSGIEGEFIRVEIPEFLDSAVPKLFEPDFLQVVEVFPEDDFEGSLDVVFLSFSEEFQLLFGFETDAFVGFDLFHRSLAASSYLALI